MLNLQSKAKIYKPEVFFINETIIYGTHFWKKKNRKVIRKWQRFTVATITATTNESFKTLHQKTFVSIISLSLHSFFCEHVSFVVGCAFLLFLLW